MTIDYTYQLESTNHFVNINTTNNKILYTEAYQLDSIKYRYRTSEILIIVVDTKEKYNYRNI